MYLWLGFVSSARPLWRDINYEMNKLQHPVMSRQTPRMMNWEKRTMNGSKQASKDIYWTVSVGTLQSRAWP